MLFAEDLPVGELLQLGSEWVTRDEITTVATQWDPLPIHVDGVFAAATPFGDVIGSGVHTLGIFQRLAVAGAYRSWSILAGAGLTVRFVRPLRPDTEVHATLRVDSIDFDSPGRALVHATGVVRHDDVVLVELGIQTWVWRR